MIQETELTLFVPSPELLVKLASGDRPLGIPAGPPRIRVLRETYFDTPDHTLRSRGMTCKLRQVEGKEPDLVVTVGEGPDSEGITSRTRLTSAAVGFGVFETLRSDSEAALQIRKVLDPTRLRPQIALDIQRLGRVHRSPLFRKAILFLYFDRITVQAGSSSAVFHELRIRRRRKGGPLIRDIGQELRDRHHLFPDGLTVLQRAYRILAMEGGQADRGLSPYAMTLALAVFREGRIGLQPRGNELRIPTFRGSGEDAARALSTDLLGKGDLEILRLGSSDGKEGRPMLEIWAVPDPELHQEAAAIRQELVWYPWHRLMEDVGREDLRHPALLCTLLLLTRRRLLGQLPWVDRVGKTGKGAALASPFTGEAEAGGTLEPEVEALAPLARTLRVVEDGGRPLQERLGAASELARGLTRFFRGEVARIKGRILSPAGAGEGGDPSLILDLLSIRVRGVMDRLYSCWQGELLPGLEASGIQLRPWSGLMREDRRAFQELFISRHLPSLHVAEEWGPSFVPEMPPQGCAVGLSARRPGWERTRFFHLVLAEETPSFLTLPGTTLVVPLEEVVRGYFFSRHPELEQGEASVFRFTTSEVMAREHAGALEPPVSPGVDTDPAAEESRRSVVLRVLVGKEMPEVYQAHLIRALERQVSRKTPLIGWPDIFPVGGPLDLSGVDRILQG